MSTPITCASLIADGGFYCSACGRRHDIELKNVINRRGALDALPAELAKYGVKRPYLLADPNTWAAAGERAAAILTEAGVPFVRHIFASNPEKAIASAILRSQKPFLSETFLLYMK